MITFNSPTNQRDRINYLVRIYQALNNLQKIDVVITASTTIKNTSIAKLGETDGGPYRRIKGWIEGKIREIEATPQLVGAGGGGSADNVDMVEARELFHKCFDLMKSRNEKYGDSWKVLTTPSLANLCEMKLHRIANLPEGAPKTEDELMDTVNYCIFGLMKLKNK